MTLQEIKTLHAFNAWADNKFFDALEALSPEHYAQDLKSSYGGIRGTMTHIVAAEKLWLERFRGAPQPMLAEKDVATLAGLKAIWGKTGFETAQWLGTMSDKKLQETFVMKTVKGDSFTHVYWQAFQHLVNHSSYHRGQIVTMLRQLGHTPPTTDLIRFYRESSKK